MRRARRGRLGTSRFHRKSTARVECGQLAINHQIDLYRPQKSYHLGEYTVDVAARLANQEQVGRGGPVFVGVVILLDQALKKLTDWTTHIKAHVASRRPWHSRQCAAHVHRYRASRRGGGG